jgi:hypothetical protein
MPARRPHSSQADLAAQDLDSSVGRGTVVEMQRPVEPAPRTVAVTASDAPSVRTPTRRTRTPTAGAGTDAGVRFAVRVLLPEGDRRSVEVGDTPVLLGSGLDELGLAGDPRAASAEARLVVEKGKLWLEPAPHSVNLYVRLSAERRLRDGDVVLMGDIAALFSTVEAGAAVDGAVQVLGGGSSAACGRLAFLRRDGSPGPVHDLPAGKTVVGRTDGHLNFPNDSRLSRRHVLFFASDQGVTVEDLDSRNGTYLRVRERCELKVEDALRIGSAGIQVRTRVG